ncbi:Ribonuclease H2 [Theobroma cacao]|nr:Ribonuclease H2 [Theobroma cacao]
MLEDQLIEIAEQPAVSTNELKKALSGLIRLGKGPSAHQLLLKCSGSRLPKNIEDNAPSSETVSALRAASICVQDSLNYSSRLESQGLKISKLLLVLLRPYIEEVLELNFRRARKAVFDSIEVEEHLPMSPHFVSSLLAFATSSDSVLVDSGMKFWYIMADILEQLMPLVVLHFGGNVLTRISQLLDKYMDALIRALPGPSDDDSLTELKQTIPFRAETDSEQLGILGIAFTIMDELLPSRVVKIWSPKSENQEPGNENIVPNASTTTELEDWRRQLQHSFDKLRYHVCRQYVLSFIYSREGKTRLNAQIYLGGDGEDSQWDTLPSLPFPPSRHVHQIASAVTALAIRTFTAREVESALPEDEWFVETAKSAINRLLIVASSSDTSEIDDDHIMIHDDIGSDSASSLSSVKSFESFASASMGMEIDGLAVEEAHFRGRKLQGTTISIPNGYSGFVLGKNNSGKRKACNVSEGSLNSWQMKAKFDKLTYWNHDSPPSKDDAFLRSFHWFAVAEALHKPVKAEDLTAASIALEEK